MQIHRAIEPLLGKASGPMSALPHCICYRRPCAVATRSYAVHVCTFRDYTTILTLEVFRHQLVWMLLCIPHLNPVLFLCSVWVKQWSYPRGLVLHSRKQTVQCIYTVIYKTNHDCILILNGLITKVGQHTITNTPPHTHKHTKLIRFLDIQDRAQYVWGIYVPFLILHSCTLQPLIIVLYTSHTYTHTHLYCLQHTSQIALFCRFYICANTSLER